MRGGHEQPVGRAEPLRPPQPGPGSFGRPVTAAAPDPQAQLAGPLIATRKLVGARTWKQWVLFRISSLLFACHPLPNPLYSFPG